MLNIQMDHANKHRYIISDQKSCVLKIRDKTHCTWTMNDKNLNMPANATHLGIRRDTSSKFGVKLVVPDRIQTARKTVYALVERFLMSVLVSLITSSPYSSLGSTKHLIMCIETIGFIPFYSEILMKIKDL
jgi:hypothetical protein